MERPTKIISGGQTGVDQVGLEVGSTLGIDTGGTVPKGFRTDTGDDLLLEMFGVIEDGSREYRPRTIKNVEDSDLTIWFGKTNSPGGKLTIKTAERLGKQILINPDIEEVRVASAGKVINIAGNRLRTNPEASRKARYILTEAFKQE